MLNKAVASAMDANITLDEIQDTVAKLKYEYPIDNIEKIQISPKLYLYLKGLYKLVYDRNLPEIHLLYDVPCELNLTFDNFDYKIIKKGEE